MIKIENTVVYGWDAAIDAVIKRDANCGIDSAEVLKLLPSAQPERERGKWDTFFSDSYKVHKIGVECSCCGYRTQGNVRTTARTAARR